MSNLPQHIGNYALEKEIGRGASSEVWLARHAHLDERHVAVKILMSHERESIKRFTREANIASRLRHPHIVQIYDHGYYAPFYCTVLEYIHGGSLRKLLERQQRLQPDAALAIFKQIAAALDYAHNLNIVHRDVSPGNVLIEQATGRALLTDFGIARDATQSITIASTIMGTPGYLSPEHTQSATAVTHLSDIFSLGVVLYTMLSGELPWIDPPGPLERTFPPPMTLKERGINNLPADIDRVIQTMLATDPAKRYPSAQNAVEELERIFGRHQVKTEVNAAGAPVQAGAATTGGAPAGAGVQLTTGGVEQNAVEMLLGPDLVRAPIVKAHQRAAQMCDPDFVAALLDAWAAQGRFGLRRHLLGRLARLHKVNSRNVYYYRLRVLYERREQPQTTEEPDHQALVFPLEPELDRWQVRLSEVKDFQPEAGDGVLLPGSTRIVTCDDCHGKGAIVCPRCKGKQRVYVSRTTEAAPAADKSGAVAASVAGGTANPGAASAKGVAQPRTEQVLAPCPECEGRGGFTCERCEGVGRLVQHKAFRWKRAERMLEDNDDLPELDEQWLEKQFGANEIYRERATNGFRTIWAQVPALQKLIEEAKKPLNDETRVVLSEAVISFIPVSDIVFDLGKTNTKSQDDGLYKLAIYGFENYIPPDWRFLNWERVIYLCIVGFLCVLLVVFGVFALM